MSFVPRFKIFASDNSTLIYTFIAVQDCNYPHSERDFIEHSNIRGQGSLIIDGGEKSWDCKIRGKLYADNYEILTDLIDDMESKIVTNTPYYLKIDKDASSRYSYKVKRISSIEYSLGLRKTTQEYTITLRSGSW